MKRLLAALLCGAVILSSGNFTSTVYAAQADQSDEVNEMISGSGGDLESEVIDSGERETLDESDDENSDEATDDTAEGTDAGEDGASEENAEDAETDVTESEAEIEEAEMKDSLDKELPEGINGLPEGFKVSAEDRDLKKMAESHNMAEELENLTAGSDYAADQVVTLADSREEAEAIAYAYSGRLVKFSYGIATISLADSGLSVEDAFEYALDKDLDLPYIEPNYIGSIEEPVVTEAEDVYDESASLLTSGEVASEKGFSNWWYSDANTGDPYLNPANDVYQWHHGMLNTYSAWGVTTGSSDITVAVIDTGVNPNHDDLDNTVLADTAPNFLYMDEEEAKDWDLYSGEREYINGLNNFVDNEGHGTHVAGIIAAGLNGRMGAGIAPDVNILSLKVGYKYYFSENPDDYVERMPNNAIFAAVEYAAGIDDDGKKTGERRADILNMSLGGFYYSATYEKIIKYARDAGCTIVVSMGNDDNSNTTNYPAAYDGVIAVCASSEDGSLATFSTFGPWADITAPGNHIYSCDAFNEDKYVYMDGTSMSAPVVSGACALYMSAFGHVDPYTMEKVIKSAVTGSAGAGTGAGNLDLARLFGGDTTAPWIALLNNDDTNKVLVEVQDGKTVTASFKVSPKAWLSMAPLNFGGDEAANSETKIVYTTDGKVPAVLNGNIIHGELYKESLNISEITGDITAETKVTIKAAAVTGPGVISKVSTLIFTVSPEMSETPEGGLDYEIAFTGAPDKLVAGKSITLGAIVMLSDSQKVVDQKVSWSIETVKGDLSKAKIAEATGKLTTAKGQTGTLRVYCTTADKLVRVYSDIEIIAQDPMNKIVLNDGKDLEVFFDAEGKLTDADGNPVDPKVQVTAVLDSKGSEVPVKNYSANDFQWTSSNAAVAEIGYAGAGDRVPTAEILIRGVGTASVTCKALNGTGKSAKINIKVSSAVKATALEIVAEVDGKMVQVKGIGSLYAGAASVTLSSQQTYEGGSKGNIVPSAWISSNSKVLKVTDSRDGTATLEPLAKGTVTVTCMTRDGSNKKASIKAAVLEAVKEITVTGQKSIPLGGKAAFKATISPKTASEKKVIWSLKAAHAGVTIDENSGVVTVAANAAAGNVTVVAKAKDGTGLPGEAEFTVTDAKATGVSITTEEKKNDRNILLTKNGSVASFRVYDTDIDGADEADERQFVLQSYVKAGSIDIAKVAVEWTSSNSNVAEIEAYDDGSAVITGKMPGTATITCTVLDGSKKKASAKVTVITPASGLTITPGSGTLSYYDEKNDYSYTALGYGGSVKVNILPSTAYGKPSVSKVETDYEFGYLDENNVFEPVEDRYQEYIKKNKLFVSYNAGKVSAKNRKATVSDLSKLIRQFRLSKPYEPFAYYGYDGDIITYLPVLKLKAYTTDGTGCNAEHYFRVGRDATYLLLENFYTYAGSLLHYVVRSDTIELSKYPNGYIAGYIYSNMTNPHYSVVSSNPNVATANTEFLEEYGTYPGEPTYRMAVLPRAKGTTKITITCLDGTNKKFTYTVKVK